MKMFSNIRISEKLPLVLILLLLSYPLLGAVTRDIHVERTEVRDQFEFGEEFIDRGRNLVIGDDTNWTLGDSPVNISRNITIQPGVVLNVSAGVEILFNGNYTVSVQGGFNCMGNDSMPVILASNTSLGNASASRFLLTAGGELVLNRTMITNITGIFWEGNGAVTNSTFENCTEPLVFDGVTEPDHLLGNITFINSTTYDISLFNSNISITDSHNLSSPGTSAFFNDTTSRLHRWKTFYVETTKDTGEPLTDCHIRVRNTTHTIYSTSHFQGGDPTTDDLGRSAAVKMLTNRSHLNGHINESANISLYMSTGVGVWNTTVQRWVDHLFPHSTMAFKSDDIYPPEPPVAVRLVQLNNTILNISWVPGSSPDIVSHGVYINDSGNFVQLENVSANDNYSHYSPVEMDEIYGFAVRAFDDIPYGSAFSEEVNITIGDVEPPAIIDFEPLGVNVPIDTDIIIRFSEPMDQLSVRTAFDIHPMASLDDYFEDDNTTFIASPYLPMYTSANYTVTLSTLANDTSGNGIAENFTFNFETVPDTTGPEWQSVTPTHIEEDGEGRVYLDSKFEVRFNEAINESSYEEGFSIIPHVEGIHYSQDGRRTFRFKPEDDSLTYDTTYRMIFSPAIKDLSGNPMSGYEYYNFTTVSLPNYTTPEIVDFGPRGGNISINSDVFLVFSEPMGSGVFAALSIDPNIVFEYNTFDNDTRFVFSPAHHLNGSTFYNITVSINAKSKAGYSIASALTFKFRTHETVHPKVIGSFPEQDQFDVDTDTSVELRFSEEIFNSGSFDIDFSNGAVFNWSINSTERILTIDLKDRLEYGIRYYVTVLGLVDGYNNTMESFTLRFTTAKEEQKEGPPLVYEHWPESADGVPLSTLIYVIFHEPVLASSVYQSSIVVLENNETRISGVVDYDDESYTLSFTPGTSLKPLTRYNVSVSGILSARNNKPMESPFNFSFTTRNKAIVTIPTIVKNFSPPNGSTVDYRNLNIWIEFSAPMDVSTLGGNITLSPPVEFTLTGENDNRHIIVNITEDLLPGTEYVLTIHPSAKDMNSTSLEEKFELFFTTADEDKVSKKEKENWITENIQVIVIIVIILIVAAVIYMRPGRVRRLPGEGRCPDCGKPILKDDPVCWNCKTRLMEAEDEEEGPEKLEISEEQVDEIFDELFEEEFGTEALKDLKEALEDDDVEEEGKVIDKSAEDGDPGKEDEVTGEAAENGDPEKEDEVNDEATENGDPEKEDEITDKPAENGDPEKEDEVTDKPAEDSDPEKENEVTGEPG